MKPEDRVGQTVMVYEDPITQRKPEGKAKLMEYLCYIGSHEGNSLEHWRVHFVDDPPYESCPCTILFQAEAK